MPTESSNIWVQSCELHSFFKCGDFQFCVSALIYLKMNEYLKVKNIPYPEIIAMLQIFRNLWSYFLSYPGSTRCFQKYSQFGKLFTCGLFPLTKDKNKADIIKKKIVNSIKSQLPQFSFPLIMGFCNYYCYYFL